jgi:hypothetical protein
VTGALASTLDVVPTFTALAKVALPAIIPMGLSMIQIVTAPLCISTRR